MISPVDIFCLAIAAGLMTLEAHRGIIPALISFIGVLIGLILTRIFYIPLSEHMRPSSAYMLLCGAVVILIAIISMIVSKRLKMKVTEVEAAIGASLGLGTALILSYALFEWLSIRYGGGSTFINDSLLYWSITESGGVREIVQFFRTLTGR